MLGWKFFPSEAYFLWGITEVIIYSISSHLTEGLIAIMEAAFNGFIFSNIWETIVFRTTDFGNAARVASGNPTKINLGMHDGALDEKHIRYVGSVSDMVISAGNKVNQKSN